MVLNPKDRLGAVDKDGYPSIKNHPFFENIDFDNLFMSTPPQIQSYVNESEKSDPVWDKYPNMMPGLGPSEMSRILKIQIDDGSFEESDQENDPELDADCASIASDSSWIPPSGNIGDISDEELVKKDLGNDIFLISYNFFWTFVQFVAVNVS